MTEADIRKLEVLSLQIIGNPTGPHWNCLNYTHADIVRDAANRLKKAKEHFDISELLRSIDMADLTCENKNHFSAIYNLSVLLNDSLCH